jgi:hypothetical protein
VNVAQYRPFPPSTASSSISTFTFSLPVSPFAFRLRLSQSFSTPLSPFAVFAVSPSFSFAFAQLSFFFRLAFVCSSYQYHHKPSPPRSSRKRTASAPPKPLHSSRLPSSIPLKIPSSAFPLSLNTPPHPQLACRRPSLLFCLLAVTRRLRFPPSPPFSGFFERLKLRVSRFPISQ